MTQERRDQKGTEVNEERLNRESGCDGGRAGGSLLSRFVPSVVSRVPTPFHSPARPGSLATVASFTRLIPSSHSSRERSDVRSE